MWTCMAKGFNYFVVSDGCVPEYSFLCGIGGRTDLLSTAALPPARENGRAFLFALTLLLVPVLVPVRG